MFKIILTSATARALAAAIMREVDVEIVIVDELPENPRFGRIDSFRLIESPEPRRGGKGRGRGRADWNKVNRGY